jgi:urease alpha subunit
VIIREALRARWDILTKEEAKSFSIGQKVFFIKAGRRIEGIVMKVNRKTVNIEVDPFTSYRVSPSFLKVIA